MRTTTVGVVVGAAMMLSPGPARTQDAPGHDLMPAPAGIEWQPGQLVVDARFTIASVGQSDPRIDAALGRARRRLEALSGVTFASRRAGARASLVVEAAGPGQAVQQVGEDESYVLVVGPRQARLTAPNALGVLHGLETLLQLARRDEARTVVQAVRITDQPRFPWRGLMLDPCRRWEPLEFVKRTLDGMAAVKLNVMHWHLSEDQGFRIESKAYPKLHQMGSDGNFYTQDQVRDVIAYARERGIRVYPEFDLPGHATSWLVGHPELGAAPGPFALIREWGIFDNVVDPSREEVYTFLDTFFAEMAALFPDAYMHIGGDEVTPRQWNASAPAQDFMYRQGIPDAHGLQAYFNKRVSEIFTRHGKRMVGWDEILDPALPKSIVIHSWRGPQALAEAARLGYDGILSNGYYLDLMFPASSHYLADPVPPDSTLSPDQRRHVLGGEACMWSEFVSPETIDSRLWPRLAAVAERLWSPGDVRDVADMYRRLEVQSDRLAALGMRHQSSYEPMLGRLTGGGPTAPMRLLADLVTPVKEYRRGQLRSYTSSTPLDRLVDTARADSRAVRSFRDEVDRYLRSPSGGRDDAALRATLTAWRDNHAVLEPILTASALGAEARPLSRDLSAAARLGLEALDAIQSGRPAPAPWADQAKTALLAAGRPRAEVELAVVPVVAKLALAASSLELLKTMTPEEWGRHLDEQLKPAPRARGGH
ncbi:MAG TPA: beta-N-acetylhexosaminidase [Vicinamibacteria bacterium]|nr:beta-N-acetylhexosaminidase [Vicinamibacteria bacterium]